MKLRIVLALLALSPALLAQQSVPTNVRIHQQGEEPTGYAPCEPSIAVDPTNPCLLYTSPSPRD